MKLLDTRRDGWRSQAEAPTDAQRASVERAIDKASSSSSSSSSSGGGSGDLPGWEEFGRKLADVLHKWLLERAKKVLEDLPAEERGHLHTRRPRRQAAAGLWRPRGGRAAV